MPIGKSCVTHDESLRLRFLYSSLHFLLYNVSVAVAVALAQKRARNNETEKENREKILLCTASNDRMSRFPEGEKENGCYIPFLCYMYL